MNVKLLLDVDVDEDFLSTFGEKPIKRQLGEAIADRLHLNEIGNGDVRMLKEVKGKLVAYGSTF